MKEQKNISLLVGLKNNLDYSINFYNTTRALYPSVEIVFVSFGSTDGTHEWLDSIKDSNVKYFYTPQEATFSETFNKATEISTKKYVAYLHNDIVLAPGFIENLYKQMGKGRVVSYTTVEPPIFAGHERPGKIIKDFGVDLKTFDINAFHNFVFSKQILVENHVEDGITFFMCVERKVLLEIGGLDSLFNPMFCEDDDLILRLKLLGLKLITSLDAICYHFVSKTSRFSDEFKNKTEIIEHNSNTNFVRKWGFRHSKYNCKFNIAYVVHNCNSTILEILEPWCDRIYIDDDMGVLSSHYLDKFQKTTSYDLNKRILNIGFNNPQDENDIVVEFDASKLTQSDILFLRQLPDVITENGEVGEFEYDIFNIKINSIQSSIKELIFIDK